ncbi:MAG: DUF2628 domain-containing protein [Bacilli bacterium]|nr:DUF2628 domain-containing protein [Bacilli bacterium]
MNNNQGNKFFTNMPVTPDNNQNNNIQNQFSQNIPQTNNQNIPQNNIQNQLGQSSSQSQFNQNNSFNQTGSQNNNFSSMNFNMPGSNIGIPQNTQQSNNTSSFGFDFTSPSDEDDNNKNSIFSSFSGSQNNEQIVNQNNKPFSSVVDEIMQETNGTNTFKSINTTNSELLNNSINILPINQMNDNMGPLPEEENKKNKGNKKTKKTKQPSRVVQYNKNITDFHRRNLLMEFVGYKYEKISQSKFNLFALIFSEFYLLYRRMVMLGLFILLLRVAIIVFINPYVSLTINVILCFTFNKLYIVHAKNKIKNAERRYPNASYDQLRDIVVSSGQTKMSNPIITVFLSIIIGLIGLVIANINGLSFGPFKDINILVLLGKNPEFKGNLTYDTNANINNNYEIVMPDEIKNPNSNQGNIIGGIKTDPNDNFSNCHYSFNVLKDFTDAKNLAKQMKSYYNLKDDPEELQINSITWYHISYENNGTVNLYLTSRNKKVYMYEFREEKNANTISCEQYNTSILNSIYYK